MNIVVVAKYLRHEIITFLRQQFAEAPFFVVSPEVGASHTDAQGVSYINDKHILDYEKLKQRIGDIPSFNWYYQQFLKYHAVLYFEGEATLIIDGDTLVKKSIVADSKVFWYTPRKVDQPYARLNKHLFPEIYDQVTPHSYITNQMLFSKALLQEMLTAIEQQTQQNWVDAIADLVRTRTDFWFSEYLMYADYALWKHPESYTPKLLKIFRRMDLISKEVDVSLWRKFDIVAYEVHHHRDILRRIRAHIYYYLNINIG